MNTFYIIIRNDKKLFSWMSTEFYESISAPTIVHAALPSGNAAM